MELPSNLYSRSTLFSLAGASGMVVVLVNTLLYVHPEAKGWKAAPLVAALIVSFAALLLVKKRKREHYVLAPFNALLIFAQAVGLNQGALKADEGERAPPAQPAPRATPSETPRPSPAPSALPAPPRSGALGDCRDIGDGMRSCTVTMSGMSGARIPEIHVTLPPPKDRPSPKRFFQPWFN